MARLPWELVISVVVVAVVVGAYGLGAHTFGVPRPGGPAGHALGIVGFVLMLAAETLYTLRKRVRRLTMGSMRTWLQGHIVCGIVGPVLVMLHSAGKLSGLAGALTLLTGLMVLSGFMGRYIYTAAPRRLDGSELGVEALDDALAETEWRLARLARHPSLASLARAMPPAGWKAALARGWLRFAYRRRVRAALARLHGDGVDAPLLEALLTRRYGLWLQVQALLTTRRLLALWYLFHVPLGAVLFTLAFVHIAAALYYSTFLK
jgi:hypothetical protein